jgi:hypothetical protein
MLVDPPWATEGEARRWLTDHWRKQLPPGVFRAQPAVELKSARWFREHGGDYALKDVRKLNGKTYQQDYTRMPRGWRTFRCHQLAFTAAEHQEHETKAWTTCTAAPDQPWYVKVSQIWIYRVDHHVPGIGGCRLYRRRQRVPRPPGVGATPSDSQQYSYVWGGAEPLPPPGGVDEARPGAPQDVRATTGCARRVKTHNLLRGNYGPPSLSQVRPRHNRSAEPRTAEAMTVARQRGSN